MIALQKTKKITRANAYDNGKPDFYMTNATYTKFDTTGAINTQFSTDKISHIPANNGYVFSHPHIKMYNPNPNDPPWDITADNGKSDDGKAKIYLWDNVRVIQAQNQTKIDFDITTTSLTITPATKFAETDAPVTIIQAGSTAKAIGATADLQAGVVKLLKQVECVY